MSSPLFSIWLTLLSPFFTASLPLFFHDWENETFWLKCGLNADYFISLVRMRTKSAIADFYGSSEFKYTEAKLRSTCLPPRQWEQWFIGKSLCDVGTYELHSVIRNHRYWLKTFELFQISESETLNSSVLESFFSLQLTVKVKGCIFCSWEE